MAALLLVGVVLPVGGGNPAQAVTLPTGFQEQIVFSGLTQPTNMEFAPDGRIFVTEKGGRIKVFDDLADSTPTLFADLSVNTHNIWDRGMLGLALPPDFPTSPYVYVLYTYDAPPGQTAPVYNDNCNANGGACVVTGRLSRLQASGNVMTGAEQVLVHDWCQQYPSHSIGDINFGADGALYVTGGDGASFSAVDYGQLGSPTNPCADPPSGVGGSMTPPTAEGGALRSQDIRTSADPASLDGAALRLNPATGAAMAGNPLIGSPDLNTRRIIASGLRNPFRFTMRPGTNEMWISDVGWSTWEEINRVASLTSPVPNFGWPCYEGAARMASYDNANLNICENLYSAGASAHTLPYLPYRHGQQLVPGEACPTNAGSSVGGAAFYPASGGNYPAQYHGALFFADYSRNCIWAMKPTTPGGLPSASNIEPFGSFAASPVDLAVGPGDELYYVDLGGTIRRIRYFPGNQPPVANIVANPTGGPAPLAVSFNGTGSTDPDPADEGRLTYEWDFTNDGTVDATTPTAAFTYPNPGTFTAKLTVRDTLGVTDSETVQITPGNNGPTAVIDTPAAGFTWKVGDPVAFTGHATDPQEGTLPASRLSWQLRLQHCETPENCHTHFLQDFPGVASGSFIAPDHEYPSYVELVLTATDSGGLANTVVRRLDPKTVNLTIASNPPGLQVTFGSGTATTPFTRTVIQGSTNTLSAPTPQTAGGVLYTFQNWSDGGAQTHVITAPTAATSYTASYSSSTFGYAQVGAQLDTGDMNHMNGSRFVTGPEQLTINSISAYLKSVRPAPQNQYQVAVYTDVNGSPAALVAASTSGTLTANSWNSRPVNATLAANTAYWLMYNTNGDNNLSYDIGSPGQGAWQNAQQPFGAWPSTFGTSTKWNGKFSIYATAGSDVTPPTVTTTVPANGATNVNTGAPITIGFSEPMAPATINATNLELRTAGGTLVNRVVGYDAGTQTATITPAAALSPSTGYTVTVRGAPGVTDVAGNTLAGNHQFSFTTAAQQSPALFGYDQIGAMLDTGDMNHMNGSRYVTGPNPLTISTIAVYMKPVRPAPQNQYQVAIYTDVNGSPGTLVAASTSGTLTANSWNTRPVTATLAANTAYWLMYNTNGDNNVSFDSGSVGQGAWSQQQTPFGTWPSSFGTAVKTSFKISIYAY